MVVWFRVVVGKYSNNSSSESHQAEGKISEQTVICHSNPASLSSTESSEGGMVLILEIYAFIDFSCLCSPLKQKGIDYCFCEKLVLEMALIHDPFFLMQN